MHTELRYTDVKVGQIFVEAADSSKPRRVRRRVRVEETNVYSALVTVFEGRGCGRELRLPLKRLTDPAQWTCAWTPNPPDHGGLTP